MEIPIPEKTVFTLERALWFQYQHEVLSYYPHYKDQMVSRPS